MIGRRTVRDLALSLIPARQTVVLALLAIVAAVALHMAAKVLTILSPWLGGRLDRIAITIEAMPLWVLIGAAMAQLSARLVKAWDDARSWWSGQRDALAAREAEMLDRARAEMEPARRHGIGRGGEA